MVSVAMLAKTFEIVRTVNWDVLKSLAFTFRVLALYVLRGFGVHILMIFEAMIAEAFGCRAYIFAGASLII